VIALTIPICKDTLFLVIHIFSSLFPLAIYFAILHRKIKQTASVLLNNEFRKSLVFLFYKKTGFRKSLVLDVTH